MVGIGLNSDFIDRYDYPDIQTKIRVISRLIERTTEKMKIFIDVNAYKSTRGFIALIN